MAKKYYGILTKVGRAVYANALLLGQDVNLKEMAIDDGGGSEFLPDENLEALPSEVYRAELNSLEKDADNPEMVIAELVIPSQSGGFYCRGFGLFTDDGLLFAVGNLAETYKATEEEGSGGELVIQADIVVTDTSALTLKVDPATVLATIESVQKAIKEHEAKENPHPQYLMAVKCLEEIAEQGPEAVEKALENLGLGKGSALPVGIPQPWPTETPPAGWLKCNGAAFDTALYPGLASAYPGGKLPDLRGEFIRGWDDGRGVDNGRGLLSNQGDAIRNIEGWAAQFVLADGLVGSTIMTSGAFVAKDSLGAVMSPSGGSVSNTTQGLYDRFYLDASRVVPTSSENRPRNISFNYIVRAN